MNEMKTVLRKLIASSELLIFFPFIPNFSSTIANVLCFYDNNY